MRKKRQRPQARECFPGAGYWLDFENIKSDDFDVVEKRLNEISAGEDRITHLLMLIEHFEDKIGDAADLLFPFVKAPDPVFSPEIQKRVADARVFRARLSRKLEHLRNLQAIEEQQSGRVSQSERRAEEIEDEPEPGKWSNRQAALALRVLLEAAGMPPGISDRDVGKFAGLLTSRPANSMRLAHAHVGGGDFAPKFAKSVADAFEEIGLPQIAIAIRRRFQDDDF